MICGDEGDSRKKRKENEWTHIAKAGDIGDRGGNQVVEGYMQSGATGDAVCS